MARVKIYLKCSIPGGRDLDFLNLWALSKFLVSWSDTHDLDGSNSALVIGFSFVVEASRTLMLKAFWSLKSVLD